jgi:hypothetical protein
LRQAVRQDLLAESRKQSATRLLRQIPSIGPIRSADRADPDSASAKFAITAMHSKQKLAIRIR